MDDLVHIPEISFDTHFWMIRTNGGTYFNEYVNDEFIAIGWNTIDRSIIEASNTARQRELLKEKIKKDYGELRPGLALNKSFKFYREIKEGDIAMIVGGSRLAFAIVGEYYEEDKNAFTIQSELDTQKILKENPSELIKCPYLKRRKIEIIRRIDNVDKINPYLYKAMVVNMHSLSSLDNYADVILSTCYDVYNYKGTTSVAFRVAKEEDINAIELSQFIVSSAQLLAFEEANDTTVKTTLNSPGEIILSIAQNVFSVGGLLLIYIAIVGGKHNGYEFNSLVGIIEKISNRKFAKQKQKTELEHDELVNEKLKEEIRSLKIVNDEAEAKKLEVIFESAKQLQLSEPGEKTIVLEDVRAMMESSDLPE